MSKHSQDRAPRLAIVGPANARQGTQTAALRWWGPQRAQFFSLQENEPTLQSKRDLVRMAVMPAVPRRWTKTAMVWICNFVRSYFVTETGQKRGAVVLSFRRYMLRAQSLRRMTTAEDYTCKKSNGSVGWLSEHHTAPQEGGRR